MEKLLNKNWTLHFDGRQIPAGVPGDITIDIFNAGLISDPYIAENYKESEWIGRKDFVYSCDLEIDEETYNEEVIEVIFKGIDLYSSIYINGHLLGHTENMFLKYVYDIKPFVKVGHNVLEVKMQSTLNKMDTFDCKDYYSIFNVPRIFTRKAQCHFGWDWAPKICAYGIWDDVILSAHPLYKIENIQIVTNIKGGLSFFTQVNYNVKNLVKSDGTLAEESVAKKGDKLRYFVSSNPFGTDFIIKEVEVDGRRTFCNYQFENPQLWWPAGYGEQPLYNYRVELIRDGKVIDTKEGRLAFREVCLKEEPVADLILGFTFYVNNVPVFCKGSNWVPIECFTGVVKDEKYRKIIQLAKDANYNILRVWGGGIYEKDVFYDICDELGLMVWQDICLACADIPEKEEDFVNNMLKEVEYQVKRLRNHPCLVHWCGGNEKTGSYGLAITHGDFFVDNLLYGFIMNLDDTRSYRRQSPYSKTDIGNEKNSGESHHNVFEMALINGMNTYHENLCNNVVPFISESAIMGPSSLETLKKIFPEDHLWPMDSMWKDRFMENPYGSVPMDFPHREKHYAEDLYSEVTSLEDFVPKAMMVHSEALRAELEYERAHKGITSGFLNWMYSDIWPSGTWATVDYYLEPKACYYQMRKSFAPIYASFYQTKDGSTHLFAVNDTLNDVDMHIVIKEKTFDGEVIYTQENDLSVNTTKSTTVKVEHDIDVNNYLVVEYVVNGENHKTIYSPNMYARKTFKGEYETKTTKVNDYHYQLEVTAKTFVKSLFIHMPDNYKYLYSDNYLDLEAGETVTVDITSNEVIDINSLILEDYKG